MGVDDASAETKVSDSGMVTIPAEIRRRLDIEAGDELRWTVREDGTLEVEVVRQRYGTFDGAETAALGGDSVETHDLAGADKEEGN